MNGKRYHIQETAVSVWAHSTIFLIEEKELKLLVTNVLAK
jgi:hypothetical protein